MKRLVLFLFLTHPLYLRHVQIEGRKLPCWYLTSDPKQNVGVYFREGHKEMFRDSPTCFDSGRLAILAGAKEGFEVQGESPADPPRK
jgi:hypothetical protein